MDTHRFTKDEIGLAYRQLRCIDYLAKNVPSHMIAGRWAVSGITRRRFPTNNIDIMVPEEHAAELTVAITEYAGLLKAKDAKVEDTKGKLKNIRGHVGDVLIDGIILYPLCYHGTYDKKDKKEHKRGKERVCNTDYVIFESPYHTPFAPIPAEFLYGLNVKIDDVEFCALNPTALYMAKMTTIPKATWEELQLTPEEREAKQAKNAERDLTDLKLLSRFVDKSLRRQMKRFA